MTSLAEPLITFTKLGVAEPLLRALATENYTTPTPIQAQAIPALLAGRDMIGIAQTGTGKTAAFALPLLQRLSVARQPAGPRSARALILAPTRELAIQIAEAIRTYGRHLGLRHTVVYGGVGAGPQIKALAGGVDILVATPGRLLDLASQGRVRLDGVSCLILDEADRMLDMGFIRDVRKIVAMMPKTRQSLLFSATMSADVAHMARELLRDPVRIEVSPEAPTVDLIEQSVHHVETAAKRALLTGMLGDKALARVMVFTRTKHGANRLSLQLCKEGFASDAIHGNKSQGARQRSLELFKQGRVRILVATDVAARGIDVDGVTHVINFDLPNVAESYVHRIGRTARAGASGIAISFCDASEFGFLRDIEKLTGRPLMVAGGEAPRRGERTPPPAHGQQKPHGRSPQKPHGQSPQKPGQKTGWRQRRRFKAAA
jgi:ATP-dependent RNA helicase RhlE